jgi:hypothetical protein
LGERRTIEEVNGGDNSIDSKNTNPTRRAIRTMEGWNATWLNMPNIIPMEA